MIPIKEIMTKNVIFAKPDTFIYEAIETLLSEQISGLPVVNDDLKLVGIVTEKDVLKLLMNPKIAGSAKVSEFMSHRVIAFKETDTVLDVCDFFIRNNVRRVPVVRDEKLIGIVSRRDVLKHIVELRSTLNDYHPN